LYCRCSNNQAEQLAIIKALEVIESLNIVDSNQHTVTVITNSLVELDSIKNIHNHSFLIEEIGILLSKLDRTNWNIVFSWIKVHAGIMENELADQIPKAAVRDKENTITYDRIPKSTIYKELEDETITNWEKHGRKAKRQPLLNNSSQAFPT
jgi:ribonuclease HI